MDCIVKVYTFALAFRPRVVNTTKSFDRLIEYKFNDSKKYFEIFLQNIWWFQKLDLSLQSVLITRRRTAKANCSWVTEMMKRKSSLIDWTIYNQNKVKEKNSNRQFSYLKTKTGNLSQSKNKKIYIQRRVWSWLRMNASDRPNTCKSRGSMKLAC